MADQLGPLGRARLVRPERIAAVPVQDFERAAQQACIAYWHVEFYSPPGLIVANEGPPSGPGHGVASLSVYADADTPRFYTLAAIHLRDLPGVPPAKRMLDHFTHELLVWTLDGNQPYERPLPWPRLEPHNLSVQWEDTDDDAAQETVRAVVLGLLHGQLSPEVQAYVPERHAMRTVLQLHQLWEDTVRTTAEHGRTGGTHDLGGHQ
jgi:hypothetical protein